MTIIDYGGGTGLLSLLAKEIGFKSVIYNDIYEGSCHDIAVLADACSLRLEAIIQGDAKDLVDYLNNGLTGADLIVSYDVIEHVYDVEANFSAFSQLANYPSAIVYGSGANIRNPFYTREVKKAQLSVENEDREQGYGHKTSDSLRSYLNLRKEIISSYSSALSADEIHQLARDTRGLIKQDIEKVVDQYVINQNLSYRISHPTNTCDPMTGNWCEHLLDFKWLLKTATSLGFSAHISKGKYSPKGLNKRNLFRHIFNLANLVFGRFGYFFSPFYVLTLKFTHTNSNVK